MFEKRKWWICIFYLICVFIGYHDPKVETIFAYKLQTSPVDGAGSIPCEIDLSVNNCSGMQNTNIRFIDPRNGEVLSSDKFNMKSMLIVSRLETGVSRPVKVLCPGRPRALQGAKNAVWQPTQLPPVILRIPQTLKHTSISVILIISIWYLSSTVPQKVRTINIYKRSLYSEILMVAKHL